MDSSITAAGRALRAGDPLGALKRVFDGALHVEGLLGNVVVLAGHDLLEAADRVGQNSG